MKVCIKTIGCRTNKADSIELRQALFPLQVNFTDTLEEANAVILFTCAVTSKAEKDVRLYISQARRHAAGAPIAVTGCLTEVIPPEKWKEMGVAIVFNNSQKHMIKSWVEEILKRFEETELKGTKKETGTEIKEDIIQITGMNRPPLKVQEGCSMKCSYCIVPKTRGKERSIPIEEVLKKIEIFVNNGAKEIIIVGVQLGAWGKDLNPPQTISHLLEGIFKKNFSIRVRLGSIEPWGINEKLIEMFSVKTKDQRLCPHIHIPLQSGSDSILKKMNRPYRKSDYYKIVSKILEADPDIAIGTDIITGFPGETDKEFEETLNFIESIPFAYLHIFTFSPRRETPAFSMPERVASNIMKERLKRLKEIDETKRNLFKQKFRGKTVNAIVEKVSDEKEASGTVEYFFRVSFPLVASQEVKELDKKEIVKVKIVDTTPFTAKGVMI